MSTEQQRLKRTHREAVVLAETKQQLGFPGPAAAASPVTAHEGAAALQSSEEDAAAREVYAAYGLSMAAVNAYLLRYLRSKHLSIDDTIAKLRRRRVFERTLPTLSVTPTTVAALRSGAFHLLDNDLEGRPVLYIDVSAFSLPTLELDEAQRLLVILLEFIQAQCLLNNNNDAAELQRRQCQRSTKDDADAAQTPASTASKGGATVQEAEAETVRHVQQFTLLVNEEGASWLSQESLLKNSSTFFSMFPKYYPLMLGSILVLGASLEIRMAIKACVGSGPAEIRDAVQMIERADLPRFLDARTIPVELGGSKQVVGSAMNLSEAVLRHWFTLTSQMEDERVGGNAGGAGATAATTTTTTTTPATSAAQVDAAPPSVLPRPLYVPPPPLGTTQRHISLHRHAIELQHLSSSGGAEPAVAAAAAQRRPQKAGGGSSTRSRRAITSLSAAAAAATAAVASTTLRGDANTDDGVCSALSGADDDDDDDGRRAELHSPSFSGGVQTNQLYTAASSLAGSMAVEAEMLHSGLGSKSSSPLQTRLGGSMAGATSAVTVSREEVARFTDHPEEALAALRLERARRQRAEQALQFRDLGVALDLRNASTVERELAAIHHDLNVLVAEVLVKAEAAGRRQKTPPSFSQMLDLTLTALDTATRTSSTVPAMALAVPVQRDLVSSGCCSFM
ncbi:CRAL/TRIO domain containing protein [Novymonas esmeraldas]|uniref:CRAL/TRIO domain containing protein n=1 Tax=Novymonas esmeraldas TaxID=1808958 RepID=A0AAW0EN81_9TRYP